jgi:hypothetical protein
MGRPGTVSSTGTDGIRRPGYWKEELQRGDASFAGRAASGLALFPTQSPFCSQRKLLAKFSVLSPLCGAFCSNRRYERKSDSTSLGENITVVG